MGFESQPEVDISDLNDLFKESVVLSENVVEAEPLISLSESCAATEQLEQAADLRGQGDTVGALLLYKKIIEQDITREDRITALLSIAGINADSGLADEAALWCAKVLELDRVSPCAHFLLGQISLQQGDRDAALARMRNAVFLDSEFIMAHVLLGNIYMENNESNGALRHFRIAMQELEKIDKDEPVPCSDNITAGRLLEMVRLVQQKSV